MSTKYQLGVVYDAMLKLRTICTQIVQCTLVCIDHIYVTRVLYLDILDVAYVLEFNVNIIIKLHCKVVIVLTDNIDYSTVIDVMFI